MEGVERARDRPSGDGSAEIGGAGGEISPADPRLEPPHLRLELGQGPGMVAGPCRKEDLLRRYRRALGSDDGAWEHEGGTPGTRTAIPAVSGRHPGGATTPASPE